MSDEELLQLNREGLIPGPDETEEGFLERAAVSKARITDGAIPPAHWEWVRLHLKEVFDFEPRWIFAFYSNRSLAPWQGGAAWIQEGRLESIQLREKLRKGPYLGMVGREEILAHEAVHGARAGFEEERFEEFFAYLASEKRGRRVLGPIVKRPWEIWPFLLAVLGGAACPYLGFFFEGAEIFSPLFFLAASLWMALGFWRLIRQHGLLKKAGGALFQCVGDLRSARAVLFRLTDAEICSFARGACIENYAEKQTCLRWRLLRAAYFKGIYGTKNHR